MIPNSAIGLIALAFGTQVILVSTLSGQNVEAAEVSGIATAKLVNLKHHGTVVFEYEPPPDIGSPKRTSGSGGR